MNAAFCMRKKTDLTPMHGLTARVSSWHATIYTTKNIAALLIENLSAIFSWFPALQQSHPVLPRHFKTISMSVKLFINRAIN